MKMAGSQMSNTHINILRHNKVYLMEQIECNTIFIAHLEQSETLTKDQGERLRKSKINADQNEMLLTLLAKRGPSAFNAFIVALRENSMAWIAQALLEKEQQSTSTGSVATSPHSTPTKEWTRAVAFIDDKYMLMVSLRGKLSIKSDTNQDVSIPSLQDISGIWHVSASVRAGILAMIDNSGELLYICVKRPDNTWDCHKTSTVGAPCRVAVAPSGNYVYTLDDCDSTYQLIKWKIDSRDNNLVIVDEEHFQLGSLKDLSDMCVCFDDKAAILISGPSGAFIRIYESNKDPMTVSLDVETQGNAVQASGQDEYTAFCQPESDRHFILAKRSGLVSLTSPSGDHQRDLVQRDHQHSASASVTCICRHGTSLAVSGDKGVEMFRII